ncbi:MAG: hypothetical protein KAT00_00130 [Planctomycetes bacterium]|nr:hypothetical protein [Planctomycetota bacterium]
MKKFKLGKTVVDLVRKFAPTIAAGLGGPVAGQAVKFLTGKLGIPDDATPTEVETALLSATPEQFAEIKKADQEFEVAMAKLDLDVFALETADTQNARGLFAINMWPQIVLSTIFVTGYFGLMYLIFSGGVKVDDSLRDMSNVLIGVLTAGVIKILDFWFGSSHGSKTKG